MRKRMEERRLEVRKRQKLETIAGFGGSDHYDPTNKMNHDLKREIWNYFKQRHE